MMSNVDGIKIKPLMSHYIDIFCLEGWKNKKLSLHEKNLVLHL